MRASLGVAMVAAVVGCSNGQLLSSTQPRQEAGLGNSRSVLVDQGQSTDRIDDATSWIRGGPTSSKPMLFDLRENNAGEQRDRSGDFPAKTRELQALYDAWWKQVSGT